MPTNNKGVTSLWGYPLIDEKARNAISDTRSSLENDFQKKTDDTLTTTDKTLPGAINEIKNSVDTIGDNFSNEQTDSKYDMKYKGKSIGSINMELTEDQIAGGDGSFNIDLTPYQTKTDTSLTTTNKTISGAINEVNIQCKNSVNKNDLEVQKTRIDNLVTLKAGSTTGDAELIDGRVGADGVTYANIGSSIRGQFSNYQKKLDDLYTTKPGKNLFDKSKLKRGYWHNGSEQENANMGYYETDLFKAGKTYILSGNQAHVFMDCYNENTQIELKELFENSTYTIPENTTHVFLSIFINDGKEQTAQIEEGTEKTDYEEYTNKIEFTKNVVLNLPTTPTPTPTVATTIIVDKNGGGNYSTVTEAVANAKQNDCIFVKNGVYENEIIKAWSKTLFIIGESKNHVIIKNNTGDYKTPPLEMTSGLLRNLTIIAEANASFTGTPAYGIHIENNFMQDKTLEIDNCHIVSYVNFAIGCGLRKGCLLDIHDSRLEGYSELQGGLYVHDTDVDSMVGLQKLRVKNTELLSNSSNNSAQQLVLQSMHKDGSEFNVEFINVNVRNMTAGNQNPCFQDASDWKAYDRPELTPNITLSKASYGNSIDKLNLL